MYIIEFLTMKEMRDYQKILDLSSKYHFFNYLTKDNKT